MGKDERTEPTPLDYLRIARDSGTRMHTLVRKVAPNATEGNARPLPDIEAVNDLFRARDPESVFSAISGLGPFYGQAAQSKDRCHNAAEFGVERLPRLSAPDADELLKECYLDPFSVGSPLNPWEFTEVGRVAKAAAHRVTERYTLPLDVADSFYEPGYLYVEEPLHDWLLFRNLMSIAIRICAVSRTAARDGSLADLLTSCGFTRVVPKSKAATECMGRPSFVIALAYNPFFSRPAIDLTWDDKKIWPFYSSITTKDEGRNPVVCRAAHLNGEPRVRVLTGVEAERTDRSLQLRRKAEERPDIRWLYLAIEADEESGQLEAANRLLRALDRLFHTPEVSCGGPMGEELVTSPAPENLPQAIWEIVRHHPDRYLASCRYCHRTFFTARQGAETTFCSPSCRSAYSKGRRQVGAPL